IGPGGAQRIAGVVEGGPGEPLNVGHAAGQDRPRAAVAEDLEEVPDRRPERGRLRRRPAPEGVVVRGVDPALGGQPALVGGDPGPLDGVRARGPQRPAVTRLQLGLLLLACGRHQPAALAFFFSSFLACFSRSFSASAAESDPGQTPVSRSVASAPARSTAALTRAKIAPWRVAAISTSVQLFCTSVESGVLSSCATSFQTCLKMAPAKMPPITLMIRPNGL